MILLTGLYLDPDANRTLEFIECIRRNTANPVISEIRLFVESQDSHDRLLSCYPALQCHKVTLIGLGRRLTYEDLFSHANRNLVGQRVIVANADIFFDVTLARLDTYDLTGKMLCLSRWNLEPDGQLCFFDHPSSQDAWIFQSPVPSISCDFHFGVPGCDNRLAWEARRAGLTLLNPGRSVRACHVHLTQVRRYQEGQRVAGATASVPAGFLDSPWLWFVVPCMGRLDDLRRTIGAVAEQPQSTCVLVDYSCPDHAGAWVKEYYPDVRVVACEGRQRFRGAEARNIGAAAVDDDGILCFLDADVTPGPEFCRHVLSNFESGTFWVADREGPGLDTALACGKRDFDRAGGFDEAFMEWGQEVVDLRASLRRIGLREHTFSAALLSHPVQRHPAPVDNATIAVHAAYRRAKAAVLDESPDSESCLEALRTLLTPGWDTPPAAIAFREQMGYTIARLEAGASSHNNELRPFSTIPGALVGLVYTQVVANVTTPVEIEFLSAGKLYVLVGTDWWGGAIATAWLRESGHHELIPPVQTRLGTRFEVWSLAADVGGTAVLPNQVMLVARHLERR